MSFIYPRTIEIRRPNQHAITAGQAPQVGHVAYGGRTNSDITSPHGGDAIIASNIPCSIQNRGGRPGKGLVPADVNHPLFYNIFIQLGVVAKDVIRDRDIVVDDEKYRYSVSAAYWNSLGYNLACVRLEA